MENLPAPMDVDGPTNSEDQETERVGEPGERSHSSIHAQLMYVRAGSKIIHLVTIFGVLCINGIKWENY